MTINTSAIAILVLAAVAQGPSPVKHVDHVMFTGGPELSGLVTILRDKFGLPVVFDGSTETPPTPFTFISFGNVCLEVVALRRDGGGSDRQQGNLGNLALHAVDFANTVDALRSRGIDHFPPEKQERWTTIGLRGVGLGFFIEYHAGMEERRARFRRELDARQGGALGVIRVIEISKGSNRLAEVRPAWNRLLGEPVPGDTDVWQVGNDLAIRLVEPGDPRRNRIVVAVKNLDAAAEALQRLTIPHARSGSELAIDPTALHGLQLVLRSINR